MIPSDVAFNLPHEPASLPHRGVARLSETAAQLAPLLAGSATGNRAPAHPALRFFPVPSAGKLRSAVEQLAARLAHIQEVAGSSPARAIPARQGPTVPYLKDRERAGLSVVAPDGGDVANAATGHRSASASRCLRLGHADRTALQAQSPVTSPHPDPRTLTCDCGTHLRGDVLGRYDCRACGLQW